MRLCGVWFCSASFVLLLRQRTVKVGIILEVFEKMNRETINMLLDHQREDIKSFVKLFIEEVKDEVGKLKKEN